MNRPVGQRRRKSEKDIARQRALTGMAFQQFNLFPHMTAAQQRHARPHQGEEDERATRRVPSPKNGSTASALPPAPITIPASFPAVSSSAWRLPGRSP